MSSERRLTRDSRCPGFAAAPLSRRGLLQASGLGFGWAAFGSLAQAWATPTAAACADATACTCTAQLRAGPTGFSSPRVSTAQRVRPHPH